MSQKIQGMNLGQKAQQDSHQSNIMFKNEEEE